MAEPLGSRADTVPPTPGNPLGLAPGWVYVRGARMSIGTFLTLHASEMAAYPDAEVAILIPEHHASELEKDFSKGIVTATAGLLAGLIAKNPTAAKWAAGVAGTVIAGVITRNLDNPEHIIIVKVRELMETD